MSHRNHKVTLERVRDADRDVEVLDDTAVLDGAVDGRRWPSTFGNRHRRYRIAVTERARAGVGGSRPAEAEEGQHGEDRSCYECLPDHCSSYSRDRPGL
jgi:hypothetical protein